ncbi:MAG: cysteine hydrolase [Spirochaetae bacterium HGW-Spirochaetae-3]|nr:MAG: cysteine hydrolase [Spirochaetae bacterium HGW-Spirochaetae-3]
MSTALLIVDVQKDYFANGNMALHGSLEASENIKKVLARFRNEHGTVIHVQHIATRENATFFRPHTPGVEFHDNVLPGKDEIIIRKNFPNSFRNTPLNAKCVENRVTRLVIVGMMTHMCIDATARAAFDLGYECVVLSDCCATKDLDYNGERIGSHNVQASFLAALNGTFCRVVDTEEYLEEAL